MAASAEAVSASAPAWIAASEGGAVPRVLSASARRLFLGWTAVFWGGVGVLGALFFVELLDFPTSTKLDLYHDCLVIWMVSYAMTNVLWEIPWVISSPFVFPLIFGVWGFHLLREDLRRRDPRERAAA